MASRSYSSIKWNCEFLILYLQLLRQALPAAVVIQVDNLGLKNGSAMVLKQTLDEDHSREGNSKKFSHLLGSDLDFLQRNTLLGFSMY